jgi:hypothetical protein
MFLLLLFGMYTLSTHAHLLILWMFESKQIRICLCTFFAFINLIPNILLNQTDRKERKSNLRGAWWVFIKKTRPNRCPKLSVWGLKPRWLKVHTHTSIP